MYRPVIKRQWIQANIHNSFSGMYLTMLSIIQGVALSLLVSQVYNAQFNWPNISVDEIEYFLMCFLTFLIIIITWHSYFWLAVVAAWTPLIWDSLLMFLIGAIEFVLVKSIGSTYWFFAVAFVGIVGGLQYHYNVAKIPESAWDNDTKDVHGKIGNYGIREKDIGGWIRVYKAKRGWWLLFISFGVLVITGFSHKYTCFSFLLIFGYSWIKAILFIGVSIGLIFSIYQHLADQKKTLRRLG